ncbi:MAG: SURF1 family protein [bacterium]|nr:SURF1 family protein [bacterium]
MTERVRDYSFMLRPKWLAGHVIVVVAIVIFVLMSFWQLRRLQDRQDFNSLLVSRANEQARELDDVLADYGPSHDELELRVVLAVGTYQPAEEIILLSKSYNGLSGHHVLTPLYVDDERAVIVDRGWVPIDMDQPGMEVFAPPASPVDVTGVLRKTEVRGSFGPVDPAQGVLGTISRVDLDRIDQQVDAELVPVYIQLNAQNPSQEAGLPAIVALPEPSEGPHRAYAVQWFLFAGVTAVGYPILLRRTAESR